MQEMLRGSKFGGSQSKMILVLPNHGVWPEWNPLIGPTALRSQTVLKMERALKDGNSKNFVFAEEVTEKWFVPGPPARNTVLFTPPSSHAVWDGHRTLAASVDFHLGKERETKSSGLSEAPVFEAVCLCTHMHVYMWCVESFSPT